MRPFNHDQLRYYGGLFNLEHRLMSAAVIVLAVVVLILVGAEGRVVQGDQLIPFDPPAIDGSVERLVHAELEGWVRPAEIRVRAPVVPILDERLLRRFQVLEPPESAPPSVREATAVERRPVAPERGRVRGDRAGR